MLILSYRNVGKIKLTVDKGQLTKYLLVD